jgi:hypothetical protein
MIRYKVETTVDITRSNPDRDDMSSLRHAQQSNFNALVQGIELRALCTWEEDPIMIEYKDVDTKWYWSFYVERQDVFLKGDDQVGLLKDDLQSIPIIGNLNNNVKFRQNCFVTSGTDCNIWLNTAD